MQRDRTILTSRNVRVRLIGPQKHSLPSLQLHHVQQESTEHSNIPRELALQLQHQFRQSLLDLLVLADQSSSSLVPRDELGELLLDEILGGGHESLEDLLESNLLSGGGGRVVEVFDGGSGDGDEGGESLRSDESSEFGDGGEVDGDGRERSESTEPFEGGDGESHFGLRKGRQESERLSSGNRAAAKALTVERIKGSNLMVRICSTERDRWMISNE